MPSLDMRAVSVRAGRAGRGGTFILAACVVLAVSLAAVGSAAGQVRIRIEPEVATFPIVAHENPLDLTIYLDNVPSPGLRVVDMFLDARPNDPEGPLCVWFEKATVDSNLKQVWGGGAFSSVQVIQDGTRVEWLVSGSGAATSLPTGTVKIGTLRFDSSLTKHPGCFSGMQRNFEWIKNTVRWGSKSAPDTVVPITLGAQWALGFVPPVDLTLSCTMTSPSDPLHFVDGDFITLECTGANIGQADAQLSSITGAVFSSDTVVNGGDIVIGNSVDAGLLRHGTSRQFTLTSQPVAPTPGPTNVCAKIDMYSTNLYSARGRIAETDESNNSQCWPITVVTPHRDLVVVPGSVSLSPSPQAPGGLFRAGLPFKIDFDVLNQGNGAVRVNHRDVVHLGTSLTNALASNPTGICGVNVNFTGVQPLTGGSTMHESFGLGTGTSTEICKIPFNTPAGDYVLVVDLDSSSDVTETDPNNVSATAESNNMLVFPIRVDLPLDPQFRVQHKASDPNDQVVEIFGPPNGTMYVAAASVRSLTSYSLTLTWSPANLMYAGTPGGPGDPNRVVFTNFLASRGLTQSCAVTGLDPNAGRLDVSCTTSDPGGGLPAMSETSAALFSVTFTPDLPGTGTLVISNFTATDGSGQPFGSLRIANGTFGISGSPDMYVDDPAPPSGVYPGVEFSSSWRVRNVGFGGKTLPLITELVVSRDDVLDFSDPVVPDEAVCAYFESSVFPGRSAAIRSASDCLIPENFRPGLYTGFYEVRLVTDPNRRSEATIAVEPRVVSVRKRKNGGRVVETTGLPDSPGGTAGAVLSRGKHIASGSVAALKSVRRNLNWMVRLRHRSHGPPILEMMNIPLLAKERVEVLRKLRAPKEDKSVLAGADLDGDGDDELVILRRRKGHGDSLEFRRIDYTQLWPSMCSSMAVTGRLPGKVRAAAGIQYDADPEDELAIATADGALSIYDVTLMGPVPPKVPCDVTPYPAEVVDPAEAQLTLVASDPAFADEGGKVISLCAVDFGLDGVEELGGLQAAGGGRRALRIYEPPAAVGGTALLLTDDPDYGGSRGGRILSISCTR